MDKDSTIYAEHVLDLFTDVLHEAFTLQPLRDLGTDLTPSLAQELQYVFQHGVCSIRDIAQGLSMTYSAASQLTDRLVKKELVTRCENVRDRRLSEIRLTEQGQKLAEQIRAHRFAGMSKILKRMSPERREALVDNLEDFISAAVHDEKSALEACFHCGKDHIEECVINEVYQAATGTTIDHI
ncbi:MAG: MarR family winged helix-turn-helix transcriptional regulator [Armatimonadota bacterium]